jgi:hypothetical protein
LDGCESARAMPGTAAARMPARISLRMRICPE